MKYLQKKTSKKRFNQKFKKKIVCLGCFKNNRKTKNLFSTEAEIEKPTPRSSTIKDFSAPPHQNTYFFRNRNLQKN